MVALTLHNISKSFGADEVLKDISLTVMDEQRLGLVGPNGAGKTTLLRIICCEMTASSGSVSVANPAGVGYLSQECLRVRGIPCGRRCWQYSMTCSMESACASWSIRWRTPLRTTMRGGAFPASMSV